jgi:hypothetical protein
MLALCYFIKQYVVKYLDGIKRKYYTNNFYKLLTVCEREKHKEKITQ